MRRVLVLNGPNLNLLGGREPEVYGSETLEELEERLKAWGAELELDVETFQSNAEGELIDAVHRAADVHDGLVINAGALSHTSHALADALRAVGLPAVEVHLTNVYAREDFRRHSVLAPACIGVVAGLGALGYRAALEALAR